MAFNSYVPFMKLKANELSGYAGLTDEHKGRIVPFFDLPAKEDMTSNSLRNGIEKAAKKVAKYLGARPFCLDVVDIPDSILIDGDHSYRYVISQFSGTALIPVLGLNRAPGHAKAVLDARMNGLLKSDSVVLRIQAEDFASFAVVRRDIESLLAQFDGLFSSWFLLMDVGVCRGLEAFSLAKQVAGFLVDAHSVVGFDGYIFSGSSIPASINEVVKTGNVAKVERVEIDVFRRVAASLDFELTFGDYTVVSPEYSDVSIPKEVLLNVTAPKVLYSHETLHWVFRGNSLKMHPRGNHQYNDIASVIVGQGYYRGPGYSWGDSWFSLRAGGGGSMVTPGSVIAPSVNAHITYMLKSQPFLVLV